jgi:hypothetical protein
VAPKSVDAMRKALKLPPWGLLLHGGTVVERFHFSNPAPSVNARSQVVDGAGKKLKGRGGTLGLMEIQGLDGRLAG